MNVQSFTNDLDLNVPLHSENNFENPLKYSKLF